MTLLPMYRMLHGLQNKHIHFLVGASRCLRKVVRTGADTLIAHVRAYPSAQTWDRARAESRPSQVGAGVRAGPGKRGQLAPGSPPPPPFESCPHAGGGR